jgi:hypothetical protein
MCGGRWSFLFVCWGAVVAVVAVVVVVVAMAVVAGGSPAQAARTQPYPPRRSR